MRLIVLFGMFLISSLAFCQGGPPMLTDDPGTPPVGKFELNVAYTNTQTNSRHELGLPLFDLAFGARENLQLKIEMPWVFALEEGSSVRGVGPASFGVKWRFQDEKGGRPAISTFPQVVSALHYQSVELGIADSGTGLLLPIEVQFHRGKWGVNFDAGFFFEPGVGSTWQGGVAVSREAGRNGEVIFELHTEGSFTDRSEEVIFQVGYRRDLRPGATLITALGRSIEANNPDATTMNLYFGCQFKF